MTRKQLTFCIFTAIFFLVFLGMRNSVLAGNHGPKPRPRAVLESIKKASDELVKKSFQDAVLPPHDIHLPVERVCIVTPPIVRHVTLNHSTPLAARAPPRSILPIS